MAVILPFRQNKLAFPGGKAQPNLAHLAARVRGFPLFAGIASGNGSFTNIVNSAVGTNGGDSSSIYANLGPVTNYIETGSNTTSSIFPFTNSTTACTLAAIFKINAASGAAANWALNTAAAGALAIGDVGGSGRFQFNGASLSNDTGVSYVMGRPYFFAVTFGPSRSFWVVKDLIIGQVRSGVAFDTAAAGDGTITVGSRGTASRQLNGGIAAAMASSSFLSQQELLQWAEDPWSLWYPQNIDLAQMLSVPVSVTPAVTKGATLPLMGVG